MIKALHKKLVLTSKKSSLTEMSRDLKIPYASLWRMVHLGRGSARNWEKADKFYSPSKARSA